MRFLLELVSCCGLAIPATPPRKEEARSLVQRSRTGSDRYPCRKRERLRESNSVSATQWRPSLCAISENKVISVVAGKAERAARSGKKVARKAGSTAKFRSRSYGDEFRRASVAMTFPAFSPTAVLF